MTPPRTRVQFVNADRLMLPVELHACLHPRFVAPGVFKITWNRTGGLGAWKHLARIRIGFFDQLLVRTKNLVLVSLACTQTGNKQFPDRGIAATAHRMAAAIPVVEIADDTDALHCGRPHSK